MSKILVLAEKPSVGKDIARVLGCKKGGNGVLEGNKYIVTWAMGHLVSLAAPELYKKEWKDWKMESLPMLPERMKLIVLPKTAKQFNTVKYQLNRQDVESIVIATDAGREGELVGRWAIAKSGVKKPIQRLWISSVTDKAIKDGFNNLKPGKAYENLYRAAECRAEADWIVGLNVTRGLTCKHNAQLSAGRVQSPTLALIVNREEEIRNFKPKEYNTISVKTPKCDFSWVNKENNGRIFDLEFSKKVEVKLNGSEVEVINVNSKDKKIYPKPLYDLTELQRDCNRAFGFSAKQTLNIMQRLYENYKILTYPRTDSRYLTSDIVATLSDRVKAVSVGDYRKACLEILKAPIKSNKSYVNDSKVSDHHAIIPTEERVDLSLLGSDDRKVYDLVVKRFLSHFMPPYIYEETTLEGNVNGERLVAKGKVTKQKGWQTLFDKMQDDDESDDIKGQELPVISKGDKLKVLGVNVAKKHTTPPARFNEATLLSAMESPQKYVNVDKTAAKTLNETGGLGTVATRADIIEKLFNSFVIEKRGNEIHPTSKGKQLIELVPEDLKSPLLTAEWEGRLDAISKGKENASKFIKEIREYSTNLVADVKGGKDRFVHDNMTRSKCPECGKFMLEVNGKKGKMLVCQDRECGHRESISMITNARCPECKKKLELRGKKGSRSYVCTGCGFKEKEEGFKKRFENKKDKVSKKEVNNIMKKMKKEAAEDINNPFADLLKGFK
ncbi:MAG: DNA topoisomerase III [Sarcina sp.]